LLEKLKFYKSKVLDFYERHEVLVSMSVFVAGFLFDLLTLGRIDDIFNLIQQAVYLVILGTLLILEIRITYSKLELSLKGKQFWQYHNLIVHFLFGSLLSVYTIFYYTSASALTSLLFIGLLAGLMLANEIEQFQKIGVPVRVTLYAICVLSYFSFFYPILMGHIGQIPFWLGVSTSAFLLALIWKFNFNSSASSQSLKTHVLYPGIIVHLAFILGYYTSFIPPVPVAIKKIGIYYDVKKIDGKYIGLHLRPFWKFWGQGSSHFEAREGDKIVVLTSIFSPTDFKDKVYLKWFYDDPNEGWSLRDSIPLSILGGRDAGFRGFGSKSHFEYGDWRVIIETSDEREVGRINFSVTQETHLGTREFKEDIY
jgi:hypothetical protein